jgi:hypothetical protein
MPALTFKIIDPCYQYNSKLDEDSFRMTANGKCIETWSRKYFTVFKDDGKWDGFGSSAHITFTQRDNRSETVGIPVDEPFNADFTDRDVISVSIFENHVYFDIHLFLPFGAFERMKSTNWSIEEVELTVNNGLFGQPRFPRGSGALISGPDPEGYEIEWHVDRQTYQFIEEFYIRFFPKSDENVNISDVLKILKDSKNELTQIIQSNCTEIKTSTENRSLSNNIIIDKIHKSILFIAVIITAILILK